MNGNSGFRKGADKFTNSILSPVQKDAQEQEAHGQRSVGLS
jgi:hypothetical protein